MGLSFLSALLVMAAPVSTELHGRVHAANLLAYAVAAENAAAPRPTVTPGEVATLVEQTVAAELAHHNSEERKAVQKLMQTPEIKKLFESELSKTKSEESDKADTSKDKKGKSFCVLFTARTCFDCQRVAPWIASLKSSGWQVSDNYDETAQVSVCYMEQATNRDLWARIFKTTQWEVPTFVITDGSKVIDTAKLSHHTSGGFVVSQLTAGAATFEATAMGLSQWLNASLHGRKT